MRLSKLQTAITLVNSREGSDAQFDVNNGLLYLGNSNHKAYTPEDRKLLDELGLFEDEGSFCWMT